MSELTAFAAPRPRSLVELGSVRRRTAAAVGLAAFLVLPLGLSDGGYDGRSLTAMTAALAAVATLAVLGARGRARLPRTVLVGAVALSLLAVWVALSASWALEGAMVGLETRRCALYAIVFVAAGLIVGAVERRPWLGALTALLGVIAAVAVVMRSVAGVPDDPYYGALLAEPVGYPNAMGVLAAIGTVLAVGLCGGASRHAARALGAVAPFLVLVLGLSGSRGGALALGAGLVVLFALAERADRWELVGAAATALAIGGAAWGLTVACGDTGLGLSAAAGSALTLGAAVPRLGRTGVAGLACVLAIAGVAVIATHPPPTTSSLRTDYWRAALGAVREHPLLGSGAGSFHLSWLEHRRVDADVRDAHSLYVETLSELGPIGLALVLSAVIVPLAAAWRGRGDRDVAAAAAGFAVFAVHAGLDWDWEMPVVTIVALSCAAVGTGPRARSKSCNQGGGDVRQPD